MGGGVSSLSAADHGPGKKSPEFVFAFLVLQQENEAGMKHQWSGLGKKSREKDVFEHLKDTFIKAKVSRYRQICSASLCGGSKKSSDMITNIQEEYALPIGECVCPAVIRAKYFNLSLEDRKAFVRSVVDTKALLERLKSRRSSRGSVGGLARTSSFSGLEPSKEALLKRPNIEFPFQELSLRESAPWKKFKGSDGVMYIHVLLKDIVSDKPPEFESAGLLTIFFSLKIYHESYFWTQFACIYSSEDDEAEETELSPEQEDPSNGLPVVELLDLPRETDRIIKEFNSTPLLIDPSEEQGAKLFYTFKGILEVIGLGDFLIYYPSESQAIGNLRLHTTYMIYIMSSLPLSLSFQDVTSLGKPSAKPLEVVERCRRSMIRAMREGKPFVIYIGNVCSDQVSF
jgi:hypothetical protein